ncbi:MAG TPA: energy-coupling factor transporter transmembrane component T [Candidatus Saccharimonadales bacterium]|nr:energy-coupling factor transporter transmembrane component T [Candidatus Saccharimonadales bacterium]
MIADRLVLEDAQLESALGRTSPVLKLIVALVWLIGLALTLSPWPPLLLTAVAVAAALTIGGITPGRLARALAPLWIAAFGVALFNMLFSTSNGDPTATVFVQVGFIRITTEAVANGIALALRVIAIAAVGATFTLTTEPTRLADALVQQAHVSPRFAYGALAAYGAIPRFAEDLATLRQARRIRGLRGDWHPRLLIGLLVLAIRHGDRMALSMDTRGFGSGPRTAYRIVRWGWLDLVVGLAAVGTLVVALSLGR